MPVTEMKDVLPSEVEKKVADALILPRVVSVVCTKQAGSGNWTIVVTTE